MYRRLKNLLGVSLIILAIVLSQLPMGAVQADTTTDEGQVTVEEQDVTEGEEEEKENEQKENEQNENEQNENGQNENEQNNSNANDEAEIENSNSSEESNISLANTTSATNTTPTASGVTYQVTFNYGFSSSVAAIEPASVEVAENRPVSAAWKIDGADLIERTDYVIDGVTYTFEGWCKDPECQDGWKTEAPVTDNMTLYAAWSVKDNRIFEITYFSDSTSSAELSQKKDVPAGKRLVCNKPDDPYKEGSRFVNWYDKNDNEIQWYSIPTEHTSYYAEWESKEYTVTFHANGGVFDVNGLGTYTKDVTRGFAIDESYYPTGATYASYDLEPDTWYTDQECLTLFDKSTLITEPVTLYKKWTEETDKGFVISADGRVLYGFVGDQKEVIIPSTVKIIATGAFSDMLNIESITLPAGISDIKADAFPGANSIARTIYIYSSSEGSINSMEEGQELANRYEKFEYKASTNTGTGGSSGTTTGNPELSTEDIWCGLSDVNLGIDDNSEFIYPKITLPKDLPTGEYQITFENVNNPDATKLKQLLQAAGHNLSSGYVYYMDITLKKKGDVSDTKPIWSTGTMTIKMPLPVSWYGRDKAKIYMFTVNEAGTALEEVSISDITNNIFTFHPKHFSEFALVFSGTITSGTGGSTSGGGNSSGGSTSGGSSSGGSTSGGSSSGGSSSGGSTSGGSSSGGSSSGGSTSGGGSSTGGSTSTITPTTPVVTTPIVTPPTITTGTNIPLVTPAPAPGTQQTVITPVTGTTGGSAGGTTSHVKDTTPKTGDPMEYRSILVCSFFSIGVLLLLIGNKKKTSSSSRYLRV